MHARMTKALPEAHQTPEHSKGPGEKRSQSQKEAGDECQKRAEKSESGARSDIRHLRFAGVVLERTGKPGHHQTEKDSIRYRGDPAFFGLSGCSHRSLPSIKGTSHTFGC